VRRRKECVGTDKAERSYKVNGAIALNREAGEYSMHCSHGGRETTGERAYDIYRVCFADNIIFLGTP